MFNQEFNPPQIFKITTIKDVRYEVLFTKAILAEDSDDAAEEKMGVDQVYLFLRI